MDCNKFHYGITFRFRFEVGLAVGSFLILMALALASIHLTGESHTKQHREIGIGILRGLLIFLAIAGILFFWLTRSFSR